MKGSQIPYTYLKIADHWSDQLSF